MSETLIRSCEKINSLEVKCAETTKESLIQLFENVKLDVSALFIIFVCFHIDFEMFCPPKQFLLNSRKNQTEELSREVKNINSAYVKEIETLKSCHFHGDSLKNKCTSSLQKMSPIKLIKSNKKQRELSSNQYKVDVNDANDISNIEYISDKCEKISEREIDESTMKSNNDIMEEVLLNDEQHLHRCRTSSKASSSVTKTEQVLNSDEIKLMSLLESVEHSRLYHYHN